MDYWKIFKEEAHRHGFLFCEVARAGFLEEEARQLEKWLAEEKHAKMSYMSLHTDLRLDPRRLFPGTRSVVVLGFSYAVKKDLFSKKRYKISKYAYGQDYHHVMKARMRAWIHDLREKIGSFEAMICVDSVPIQEVAWAARAGAGWVGKHSLLLRKGVGSFFFLGLVLTDLPLISSSAVASDHCGTCRKCIEACPTQAIEENRQLDAGRCISYLSIELREEIPEEFRDKMEGWIFGCDICQDVCPWNRHSVAHQEPMFLPSQSLVDMQARDWENLTEKVFRRLFKGSAVKRTKYGGLRRNIEWIRKSGR
ncbi:MAG: tRNA epoxyqueuosine(34) reductase QueG [Cytophagales bacterium]|nr:tRNA epoxyqueuosine(34) reductase QueG [Cytophagales bacterium]